MMMAEEIGPETHELQQQVVESLEQVHEELAKEHEAISQDRQWIGQIGVSTAILSAIAAATAMYAGSLANEGMVAQIQATDQWALYQSKSTKQHLEQSNIILLQAFQKPVSEQTKKEITKLEKDKQESQAKARELEQESRLRLERHEMFARSVAALQIGISLGAVAILLRKKWVWYLSLGIAIFGVGLGVTGIIPTEHSGESPSQVEKG